MLHMRYQRQRRRWMAERSLRIFIGQLQRSKPAHCGDYDSQVHSFAFECYSLYSLASATKGASESRLNGERSRL